MEFYLIRGVRRELISARAGASTRMSEPFLVQPEVDIEGLSDAKNYCIYLENSLVENAIDWKTLEDQSKVSSCLRMFMTLHPTLSSDKPMARISISQSNVDASGGDVNILDSLVKVHGKDNVKAHVLVTGMDFDGVTPFKFEAQDLVIQPVPTADNDRTGVQFSIRPEAFPLAWRVNWDAGKRVTVSVTLSVFLNHKAVSELHLESFGKTKLLETAKVILTDDVYSDFVIIAANGAEVKCHRAFLAARNDVFKAMFESKMKEDASRSMEMEDMSEDGVRALLAYLYHWDLKGASESCAVAFELYRAAEKYNISELEEAMRTLICAKPKEWFSVDTAVRLLLLARNLKKKDGDEASGVLKKAMRVIQWYGQNSPDKLRESEEYQRLYKTSPETALEVGLLFLQVSPSL